MLALSRHLSIAKITNHLEDLAPRRERPIVEVFVLVNGHDKLEELIAHFPLFRLSSQITPASPRATAPFQTGATINR